MNLQTRSISFIVKNIFALTLFGYVYCLCSPLSANTLTPESQVLLFRTLTDKFRTPIQMSSDEELKVLGTKVSGCAEASQRSLSCIESQVPFLSKMETEVSAGWLDQFDDPNQPVLGYNLFGVTSTFQPANATTPSTEITLFIIHPSQVHISHRGRTILVDRFEPGLHSITLPVALKSKSILDISFQDLQGNISHQSIRASALGWVEPHYSPTPTFEFAWGRSANTYTDQAQADLVLGHMQHPLIPSVDFKAAWLEAERPLRQIGISQNRGNIGWSTDFLYSENWLSGTAASAQMTWRKYRATLKTFSLHRLEEVEDNFNLENNWTEFSPLIDSQPGANIELSTPWKSGYLSLRAELSSDVPWQEKSTFSESITNPSYALKFSRDIMSRDKTRLIFTTEVGGGEYNQIKASANLSL